MGLAQNQEVPNKPEVREPWTIKRLFSFGAVTTLAKVFVNPLDILFGYLVFILGIAELFGRQVSWFIWAFTVMMLIAIVFERHFGTPTNIKKEEKTKK